MFACSCTLQRFWECTDAASPASLRPLKCILAGASRGDCAIACCGLFVTASRNQPARFTQMAPNAGDSRQLWIGAQQAFLGYGSDELAFLIVEIRVHKSSGSLRGRGMFVEQQPLI